MSAFLDGSDWAAKTNSAIAALPPGGGTVFVPAFLAGSASTALTIPSNVSVLFDAGTFSTSSTITFSGSGNRVQGVPNATILSFTGATDGFIVADNATLGKYIVIDGFRLQTTSAAGGKAIKLDGTVNSMNNVTVRNIHVARSGSGLWAYGAFMANFQHSTLEDVHFDFGCCTVQAHAENSTNEDNFNNVVVQGAAPTVRGWEIISGAINGCEINIFGGTTEGVFSGSDFYMLTNAGQSANIVNMNGMHIEATGGTLTDGAAEVDDGGTLRMFASGDGSSFLTKNTNATPQITISGGSVIGAMTLSAASEGTVSNSKIASITANSALVSFTHNISPNGPYWTDLPLLPWCGTLSPVNGNNFGFPVGSPVFCNNLKVWAVDSTGQAQPAFNPHDASDNRIDYYQSTKAYQIWNTVNTVPTTDQLDLNDSGLAWGGGSRITSSSNVTQTIASGTATMSTVAVAAGTCGTTVTVAASGVTSADTIDIANNAPVAANPGVLIINKWPTAGNVNFNYCNPTSGDVTPDAATLNWRVVR